MYNEQIMNRFLEPKYAGKIMNADGVGSAKNEQYGDVLKIFLTIEDDRIVNARFKAFGSPITFCASDIAVEKIIGKTLDEALELTNYEIECEIEEENKEKLRQSILAEEAILAAVTDYRKKIAKLEKKAKKAQSGEEL